VAQVFVSDEDWYATLRAIRTCLRPGGWFVFETQRSEVRDWETWDLAPSPVAMPDGRTAVVSCTVTDVAPPLVTFEGSTAIGEEIMRSTSTLRFRERNELERDLSRYGFNVLDVRDAPDRPGKEMVFLPKSGTATTTAGPDPELQSPSAPRMIGHPAGREDRLVRFTFQPGWRWSECVKPVAGTDSCQVCHVGAIVAGPMASGAQRWTRRRGRTRRRVRDRAGTRGMSCRR
jgi:hypothetical protein